MVPEAAPGQRSEESEPVSSHSALLMKDGSDISPNSAVTGESSHSLAFETVFDNGMAANLSDACFLASCSPSVLIAASVYPLSHPSVATGLLARTIGCSSLILSGNITPSVGQRVSIETGACCFQLCLPENERLNLELKPRS